MKKISLLSIAWFILISMHPVSVFSEIFKYIDQNGNTAYTDDISRIPQDKRDDLTEMSEIKSAPKKIKRPEFNQEATSNTNLSFEDEELLNTLREKGYLPANMKGTPSSEEIRFFKMTLKNEYGIEDITTWEPDLKYSSPESTWELHKNALARGDIETALECMLPKSRKARREVFQALGPKGIRKLASQMNNIEKVSGDEDRAKYVFSSEVLLQGKMKVISHIITFYNIFGEWKIKFY